MQIDWERADEEVNNIVQDYRRSNGVLRREQLEIISQFDDNAISSQDDSLSKVYLLI